MLLATLLFLLSVPHAFSFAVFSNGGVYRRGAVERSANDDHLRMTAAAADDDDDDESHPLSKTSRLSHAMLKVKSVDETCSYWMKKGGKILRSRQDEDGAYLSAFVALGNGKTTDESFALELVRSENSKIGNVINYIGVSLLLQFQGNLKGLISGQDKAKEEGDEPNGFFVKSCASSPGDFLCRLCLKSNNLEKTHEFYTEILGMELAAGDDSQICLRYVQSVDDDSSYGVPITLVFEGTNERLDFGTCFDHLAIRTTSSINELFERFQNSNAITIYMNPIEMFGMTVMGLRDPNGYKVVLAGPP